MTPTWAVLIYGTFVVGGLSVYLLMPSSRKSVRTAGALFGLAALAGAMVLCGSEFLSAGGINAYFYPRTALGEFLRIAPDRMDVAGTESVSTPSYGTATSMAGKWLKH